MLGWRKKRPYHFHLCANHRSSMEASVLPLLPALEVFLLINGLRLLASDDEIEELDADVARSRLSKDQVIEFFAKFVVDVEDRG